MSETQTPPGGAAPPAAAWHTGKVDAEMLGTWQNKGWDAGDPAAVAIAATKAYHEAQKFVGAPPDALLRMPKDAADEAGWKAVWKRLGAPDDKTGYDFTGVKRADGTAPDAKLTDAMRDWAAQLNMPKDTATQLANNLVKHLDSDAAARVADTSARLAEEKATLAKNWGSNMEANTFVARQAANALGISAEAIAALESQIGYAKVMDMFRTIGTKIGEDKFVSSGAPGQTGVMSVSQAHDQLRELKSDSAFVKRYMEGDSAARRQMEALHTLIASSM